MTDDEIDHRYDAMRYMTYEPKDVLEALKEPKSMKESERFREFAEKFVLARAPDGPEGVWQAVLDAKTAYKQIEQATEEYARPEREAAQATIENQRKFMRSQQQQREQKLIYEQKNIVEVPKEIFDKVKPEDKASWQSELARHFRKVAALAPSLSRQEQLDKAMQRMKLPGRLSPKT